MQFPATTDPEIGIANVAARRLLVFGNQLNAGYSNNLDGCVDVSVYALSVYDLANGSKLWTKSWSAANSSGVVGATLATGLSGVAAFHAAGTDQMRVATQQKNTPTTLTDTVRY
jgi:hypothetical protein